MQGTYLYMKKLYHMDDEPNTCKCIFVISPGQLPLNVYMCYALSMDLRTRSTALRDRWFCR